MEPNYSEYSISELEELLRTIDQDAFPERTEKLKSELSSRRAELPDSPRIADDNFEPNEQFYKCPNCEEKIGIFSKTANKWGKVKNCLHCGKPFTSSVSYKVFAIAFIPMLFTHWLILKPLVESFGLNKSISIGILCGIVTVLSIRFKRVSTDGST